MAQNLYFHSLADNRGVLIMIADRAAEEDVEEVEHAVLGGDGGQLGSARPGQRLRLYGVDRRGRLGRAHLG